MMSLTPRLQATAATGPAPRASRRPLLVHVIDSLGMGGMETVAVNVIEHSWDRYRHCVICLRRAGINAERLRAAGVKVIELKKRPGKDFGSYWRLMRLLRRIRPDLLQTYNLGAIDVAAWARLAGVPRVVHAEHGRDASDPYGRRRRYRWLRRMLSPAIDGFVAVSNELAIWMTQELRIPADKVHLIRNGIDVGQFAAADTPPDLEFVASNSVVIGSVGRLDSVKAFDGLIDAFDDLCRRQPGIDLRLVIIGDGPERGRLAARVHERGLDKRVWLAGARDDVARWLQRFDIYTCSSIAEGIALTIIEAMASGLPVVATRVGGNPELVVPDETGLLVPAGEPAALALALEALVQAPEIGRAMGRAGRLRARDSFSRETMTAAYCQLYDRVLGVPPSGRAQTVRARS